MDSTKEAKEGNSNKTKFSKKKKKQTIKKSPPLENVDKPENDDEDDEGEDDDEECDGEDVVKSFFRISSKSCEGSETSEEEEGESDKERCDQRLVEKSQKYPEVNSLHSLNIRGLLLNKNRSKPTIFLDTLTRDNSEGIFLSEP